jgi:hypothetical protein
MNHNFQYICKKHYFLTDTFGELTGSGSIAIFYDLFDMGDWETESSILVDHRNASVKEMTLEEIEDVSCRLKENNNVFGRGKMSVLMSPNGELSKYAMWKISTGSEVLFSIDIFARVVEAEEWFSHPDK